MSDKQDIVERLRCVWYSDYGVEKEAAAEIERLRGHVKTLREAADSMLVEFNEGMS